jgi:hypothetical protein
MLDNSQTAFLTFTQPRHDTSCLTDSPTSIEADRARRFMAEQMLVTNHYLIGAIHATNNYALMAFGIPTNLVGNPPTAPVAGFSTPTNGLIIFVILVINRQVPIFVLQNSPIQAHALQNRPIRSLDTTRNHQEPPFVSIEKLIGRNIY